jgi:hypothetical protein
VPRALVRTANPPVLWRMASFFASGGVKLEGRDFQALSVSAPKDATRKGYMTKQGHQNKSSWIRRYFVQSHTALFYYAGEDCRTCVGMIWLEGSDVKTTEGGRCLVITSAGGRPYSLRCDTAEDCSAWQEVITQAKYAALRAGHESLRDEHEGLQSRHGEYAKEADDLKTRCQQAEEKVAEEQALTMALKVRYEKELAAERSMREAEEEKLVDVMAELELLRSAKGIRMLPPDVGPLQTAEKQLRIW